MQFVRDVGNFKGVTGDVVSLHAVPTGEGPEQHAVLVCEADGRAIELEFAAICEGGVNGLGCAFGEFLHLLNAVGVAQGQHGIFVRVFGEAAFGGVFLLQVRPHFASRGVRRCVLRILRFQVFQFMHELVVLEVAHRGRILHIILPAVLPENSLQLFNPVLCLDGIHTFFVAVIRAAVRSVRARICVHKRQR